MNLNNVDESFRRSTRSLKISLTRSQESTRKKRFTLQCLSRSSCYQNSTSRSARSRASLGGLVSRSKIYRVDWGHTPATTWAYPLLVYIRHSHCIVVSWVIISKECKLVHRTSIVTFPFPILSSPFGAHKHPSYYASSSPWVRYLSLHNRGGS